MIVLDTNVLVALVDERDSLRGTAAKDFMSLARQDLYTIGPVLGEAIFLLPRRDQRRKLREFLIRTSVRITPTESLDFWEETLQWMDRYSDHSPDWADACLAVVSEKQKRSKLWTYDSEFRTIWRRPDGSRIAVFPSR